MLDARVLDLVERFDAATDPAALRRLLTQALEGLGLPHMAYANLSEYQRTGDLAALCMVMTFPGDWTDYYQSRHYQDIDPVFHAARFRRRPFAWADLAKGAAAKEFSRRQRGMIAEASAVGMAHGMTVPLFGPDGEHAIVSVASAAPLEDWPVSPAALGAIATHFHLVHQDLAEGAGAEDPTPIFLYPREREVLLWCARGKSSWEIGRILNVAERTVDHYVEAAMRKLAVTSRVAAVLKATRHGIITP